jgi:hypothetical protein
MLLGAAASMVPTMGIPLSITFGLISDILRGIAAVAPIPRIGQFMDKAEGTVLYDPTTKRVGVVLSWGVF